MGQLLFFLALVVLFPNILRSLKRLLIGALRILLFLYVLGLFSKLFE